MKCVAVARNAMATRFEVVAHGENEISLRAAAEEALTEIERIAAQMSLFHPQSEISRINALAAKEPVPVEPSLFRLLQRSKTISEETGGAFDITVAPLMRCWGFVQYGGRLPDPEALAEARERVGMHRVELDPEARTVRFAMPGVRLDLGAIAKGYAIEAAAELLVEAGITSAILHGGTSTVHAIGAPPEATAWNVGIRVPETSDRFSTTHVHASAKTGWAETVLAVVPLKDEAMSVSAVWGRAFEVDGRVYGHVIDPRKGQPVEAAVLSAIALASATDADALSTALLTVGPAGHETISRLRPGTRSLVVSRDSNGSGYRHLAAGVDVSSNLLREAASGTAEKEG